MSTSYSGSTSEQTKPAAPASEPSKGIRGWLVLLALNAAGVFLSSCTTTGAPVVKIKTVKPPELVVTPLLAEKCEVPPLVVGGSKFTLIGELLQALQRCDGKRERLVQIIVESNADTANQ
jgi:hypothetical protein